jgi:hypothetical protein
LESLQDGVLVVKAIEFRLLILPEGHAVFPLAGRQRKMQPSAHVCG